MLSREKMANQMVGIVQTGRRHKREKKKQAPLETFCLHTWDAAHTVHAVLNSLAENN